MKKANFLSIPFIAVLFAITFTSTLNAHPADSPWAMYQHDARHTGQSPYYGPENPVIKWKYHQDMDFTSDPVVMDDGTVYAAIYGGTLCAINSDMSEKWRYKIEGDFVSRPIVAEDNTTYFTSSEGCLYALNPDGSLKWSFNNNLGEIDCSPFLGANGEIYVYYPEEGSDPYVSTFYFSALNPDGTEKWKLETRGCIDGSPAIAKDGTIILMTRYFSDEPGDTYYICAINPDGTEKWCIETDIFLRFPPVIDKSGVIFYIIENRDNNSKVLVAINPDGTEKWRTEIGHDIYVSPVIGDDSTIYIIFEDRVEVGEDFDTVVCLAVLNPDGTERWRTVTKGDIRSLPAIAEDGTIYVGRRIGERYPYTYYLWALNPDGVIKWQFQTEWRVSGKPVFGEDGTLYIGAGHLYALTTDGNELWNLEVDSSVRDTPIQVSDGSLYVWGKDYYYKVSSDGKELWKFRCTGDKFESTPSIDADGTIYVGSYNHNLYALNPDGTVKWSVDLYGEIEACPAIGADGTIYAGTEYSNPVTGHLYALNKDGTLKWSSDTAETNDSIIASPVIGNDNNIYLATWGGFVYSIKPDSTINWKLKAGIDMSSSLAIGNNGDIYVRSGNRFLYSLKSDGSLNWSYSLILKPNKISPAIGGDGTIYMSSGDDGYSLTALNPDGSVKWQYSIEHKMGTSPAIGQDETIYFGMDNSLYALNPNGALKWIFESSSNSNFDSAPIIDAGGVIYVHAGRNLYALNPGGTLKWKIETEIQKYTNLAMGKDGTIYLSTGDQYLCAIGDPDLLEVDIYSNATSFHPGDTAEISVKVVNPTDEIVDMYAAVMLNGLLFFYPLWDELPHATEIEKGTWDEVIASFYITSSIPSGSYTFYTAIAEHNTANIIDFDSVTISINE